MPVERDTAVDALRGLAVAFVVLGHVILDAAGLANGGATPIQLNPGALNPLVSLAYSFQIPLLVFVAGYVFWRPVPVPARTRLLNRIRGLVVPYFAWFLVFYAIDVIVGFPHATLPHEAEGVLVNSAAPDALWFLYALFMCSLVLIIVEKLPGTRWTLPLSALLCMGLWGELPWRTTLLAVTEALWLYPFIAFGYLVSQHREWVLRRKTAVACVALPIFALLAWAQYPIQLPARSRLALFDALLHRWHILGGFTVAFYVCAFSAALGLFALYEALPRAALAPQAWVGRRTLGVYASSELFASGLMFLGVRSWPVMFVISLAGSLVLTLALERTQVTRTLLLGQPWRQRD